MSDVCLPTNSATVPSGPDVDGVSDFDALHSGKHEEEVQLCAFDILVEGDETSASCRFTSASPTSNACWRADPCFTLTAATDGNLTDGTVNNGLFSPLWRVEWTSVGTYAGDTALRIDGYSDGFILAAASGG